MGYFKLRLSVVGVVYEWTCDKVRYTQMHSRYPRGSARNQQSRNIYTSLQCAERS